MTAEQVQENERQSFLDWRRDLAALQVNIYIFLVY